MPLDWNECTACRNEVSQCTCVKAPRMRWYVGYFKRVGLNGSPGQAFQSDIEPLQVNYLEYHYVVGPYKTKRGASYVARCPRGAYESIEQAEAAALAEWENSPTYHAINRSAKPRRNHNPKPTISQKSLLEVYRAAARVFSVGSTKTKLGELGRRLTELEEAVNRAEVK